MNESIRLLIFSLSLLSTIAVFNNWKDVKPVLSSFKDWALRHGTIGWIVYGGACGVLVAVVTFPWSY